jgi:D-3-phosphoglycerate dehydrogenase
MSKAPRIVVLNGTCLEVVERHRAAIEARGVELVAEQAFCHLTSGQIDAALQGADALVVPASISEACDETVLRRHPSIKTLAIAASGFDWLDVDAMVRQGVVVTNAPIPELCHAVAEMTIGLMLAAVRQIPLHDRQIRSGDQRRAMGVSVHGKTLGIVGLGAIGKCVVRAAAGLEMELIATAPRPDATFVAKHRIQIVPLDDLLRRSDIVSLHLRLNAETRGMIAAPQLRLMKPTAYLVNTARRDLVDEPALAEALASRQIAGAGLDDPPGQLDSPLLQCDRAVFTTHLGNRTFECADALFNAAMDNALTVLSGRRAAHVVNQEVYDSPALRAPLGLAGRQSP